MSKVDVGVEGLRSTFRANAVADEGVDEFPSEGGSGGFRL